MPTCRSGLLTSCYVAVARDLEVGESSVSDSPSRRRAPKPAHQPGLDPGDPLTAFGSRLRNIKDLDDLARQ
jgi:hypothetical protein